MWVVFNFSSDLDPLVSMCFAYFRHSMSYLAIRYGTSIDTADKARTKARTN